ncbi:Centrosomal protein of 152 kDa like protein [Argiope bruennichi]|uniref:Centrosomal protein of 152 kDa like protein n=1 Tax=Argiope bruennichi TaxID=94029 RepID=A0A8T0E667_ARGBR|nr:Centrosomal protein of 152 kDa like protein [Argiope bruennichi]
MPFMTSIKLKVNMKSESESDSDSETEDEDEERSYRNNRSLTSEEDESSAFSAANTNFHRKSYSEYENGLKKEDSYNRTVESDAFRPSHSVVNSHVSDGYDGALTTGDTSQYSGRPNYPNGNISDSDANHHRELSSVAPINSAVTSNSSIDLKEEYRKLYIIYETTFQELSQLKAEEMNYRKETDNTIQTLKLNLDLLESEKNKLSSNLQDSQNLISDYEHEKNKLLGEVMSLNSQLSSVSRIKDEIQSKLESSQFTIQSLEKQLNEFNRADHMSRLRGHHNSILEEMKLRHEKDTLSYKENIDNLQSKLNSKIEEAEDLALKNSELQRKYQQLQIEKAEWVNKMSEELEVAQKKCQLFLESGTIEEINRLKLQVQHLEEDKSNIERENSLLKDEIKSLKAELDTAEALQKLAFSKGKQEASVKGQKDMNLQQELENSLKNVRSLRSEKHSLKKQLNNTEIELKDASKRAELFESQYIESKKRLEELEEKLRSISSNESTTIQFYEKKIQNLENELSNLKKSVYDASINEKMLIQSNEELQKKMTELIQKHMTDKIQAVKTCQEQLLELHESTLQKEKEKIESKANAELKDVCFKYENKISEMQKEIKALNDGLYDSKNQYLALYKENQNLQAKFDEISKPKEREEIEKEIRLEYEGKLIEMKAQLIKQNKEYLASIFKEDLEKAQLEWTKQKMVDIKDFIENTKQRLSDEFQNCLQKEQMELQRKLESEKERLHKEFEETKVNLKKRYEEDRDKLTAMLNQDLQCKWEKKLDTLKERHENEIKYMQNQFDSKLLQMENEMKCLKEKISVKTDENDEVQKLKQDFMFQQEKWQEEKDALVHAESVLNENLKSLIATEQKLRDKLKRYQRHVAAVKKHYEEKIRTLQAELSDFQKSCNEKQNQLHSLQAKHEQDLLQSDLKKYNPSRNVIVQTEEEMVPKSKIYSLEDKFFKCLMNISDGIRHYVNESKKRNAEKIQSALMHYHQQISSKLLQDLSKDAQSFAPTIVIPRASTQAETISKETYETSSIPQNRYNTKFKTSTPANLYSTDKHFEQAEKISRQNDNAISNELSLIPNFNPQTSIKSVHSIPAQESSQSRIQIPNLYSAALKTPRLDIFNSGDSLLTEKVIFNKGPENNIMRNHINNKDYESVDRFEDISYDFLSLNLPSGLFDPSKMTGHRLEQGDNVKYFDNNKDSFPVKLFSSEG